MADRARRGFLRLATLTGLGRACIRDRSLRLPLLAVLHAAFALVLAAVVPLWALLVGPLLLGVPHVIADVRYLVLDRPRGLSSRQVLAILLPLTVAAALSATVSPATSPVLLAAGLVAIGGSVVFARATSLARIATMALLAAFAVPLLAHYELAFLVLAHAHNAVAVGLWLALSSRDSRRRPLLRFATASVLLAGGVAIGAGWLDFVPLATGGWNPPADGFDATAIGKSLELPGLGASRSVMLFAYGQAVHYAVWLRLVPGERAATGTPVSFRRGMSGLSAALGMPALAVALVLALAVPLAGLLLPVQTRRLYLDLAAVHAWLELAVAAHLGLAWVSSPRGESVRVHPIGMNPP